jgi:hypothetical protein
MANRTKLTPKKRKAFIAALATGSVSKACEMIGMCRQRLYEVKAIDEAFSKEWDSAIEQGTDALEDEAWRRAVEGVDDPVYFMGTRVDTVRKYSDGLLTLLLKSRRPDKYRERTSTELTGKDGKPLAVVVEFI